MTDLGVGRTDRGYVVVLFGDMADGWCALARCPLGTAEWFATRESAAMYCDTIPAGLQPHILSVRDATRAPLPTTRTIDLEETT